MKKNVKNKFSIIPLGGVGEIGKNMMVFECAEDIIIVDAGVSFPGPELPGVDLVIPDISYLVENKEKIKSIFITHGHEDHIGALPYLLKEINVPVYSTKLTIGLIKKKLAEHNLINTSKLIEVSPDDMIKAGVFKVSFFRVNHSIPDGIGLAIDTPEGLIIHSGDFKLDQTPIDGKVTEFNKLTAFGETGVLLLICDSTGAENKGYTPSEKIVGHTLRQEFEKAKGRIIVASFASSVHRIQQIINAAIDHNRKIAIVGRSMVNVVEAARELGYLSCPDTMIIDVDKIDNFSAHEIVIITTGSQGEPLAALTRIATGSHYHITLHPSDTVIISASPIPGNIKHVYRTINNLFKGGANVIYKDVADVHVSGHAAQEEIKIMLNLVKPRYVMPFHGEYRHLIEFSKIASSLGIPKENTIICEIGDRIIFQQGKISKSSKVKAGSVFIDGLGIGDVGNVVLRDRRNLAEDGIIAVVLTLDKTTGKVLSGPDMLSRGFIYVRESDKLIAKMQYELDKAVKYCTDRNIKDWSKIKDQIRKSLDIIVYSETKRNPIILPIIMEV